MIALYLLAAHMVGDFILQTRWQAAGKLTDPWLRVKHVWVYSLPFWPIAVIYGHHPWWHSSVFTFSLIILHYLTDSRRFNSTLGDWVAYRGLDHEAKWCAWLDATGYCDRERVKRTPPSPWAPLPILIDQSLHACQLALLGGLLLA